MTIERWDQPEADLPLSDRDPSRPLSVAIGVFDGVHRGHRALLERVVVDSGMATVLTFAKNPAAVTRRESYLGDISSLDRRLGLFAEAGIEAAIVIDFSERFAQLDGKTFVNTFLQRVAPVQTVVVGYDFHLGRGRDTHAAEIRQMLEPQGVRVDIVPALNDNGEPISSSRIRHSIRGGRFETAARLLGRPYAYHVAGSLPASLAEASQVLPAAGAYQARYIGDSGETFGTVRVNGDGTITWDAPGTRWRCIEFEQAVLEQGEE